MCEHAYIHHVNLSEAICSVITAAGSPERVAVETGSSFAAVYAWWKGKRLPKRNNRLELAQYAQRLGLSKRVVAALQPDFSDEARP